MLHVISPEFRISPVFLWNDSVNIFQKEDTFGYNIEVLFSVGLAVATPLTSFPPEPIRR